MLPNHWGCRSRKGQREGGKKKGKNAERSGGVEGTVSKQRAKEKGHKREEKEIGGGGIKERLGGNLRETT